MLTVFDTLASVLLRELEILTEPGKQASSQSGKSLQMTDISSLDMDSGKAASEHVDRRCKQVIRSTPILGRDWMRGSISRSNDSRSMVIHVLSTRTNAILKRPLTRR